MNKFVKIIAFLILILALAGQDYLLYQTKEKNSAPISNKIKDATLTQLPKAITSKKYVNTSDIKRKWMNVPYASKSSFQKMDIYLPNQDGTSFPVVVLIHGGGYRSGDKTDELDYLHNILDRGYAVASINYRLVDESVFPTQIYDVKAAIRYIRANAISYNLNPNKIIAWGASSGGHLAALAGTSSGIANLTDLSLGNASESDNVQAFVDWFGPIDFLTMDEQFRQKGVKGELHNVATSTESLLLGQPILEVPGLVRSANPESYIDESDPPSYIQHGTVDIIVPIEQSMNFAEKLKNTLGPDKVRYDSLEGAIHGDKRFGSKENINRILDFLDIYMK